MVVGDIYEHNAAMAPHACALVCDGLSLTNSELLDQAVRLANALHDLGLRPGMRLAIYGQNSAEWIIASAAAEIAGYIVVAVNFRLAPAEILHIIADTEPHVLAFDAGLADTVAQIKADLDPKMTLVSMGEGPDWARPFAGLVAAGAAHAPRTRARPHDIAHIIYTSGSTGRPLGVMWSHERQCRLARQIAMEAGAQADDVQLITMPLFHIGAKCLQLGYALRGAKFVVHRRFEPDRVVGDTARHGVTALQLAPVMLQSVMDVPDLHRYDLGSLRIIYYASAPMAETQIRRALTIFGPILMQHYGMTEIGLGTVLHPHQHRIDAMAQSTRLQSAGQPPPGSRIRILRADGADAGHGEPGEIAVANCHSMTGYWNDEAGTLRAIRDGWVMTGDIGYLDDESYLFIVDRKKDMIVSGGENIFPREIEAVLEAHPAVASAAVIGVPDDRWGESVKAFVVLVAGSTATEGELIAHCKAHLASYKKPKSVEFRTALPRLGNLKLDKKALRAPYWAGHVRQIN